jgi:P-type E1-E2 ATPase
VPGDLVRIRAGDVIPADLKLISGALSGDQSALTGESKDVNKSAGDLVSSGSLFDAERVTRS